MKKATAKRAQMREVFATWKSSGLSLRAFGAREGLRYQKLLYWKKKLAGEADFAPVRVVGLGDAVVESRVESMPSVVSVWLANGVSFEVPSTIAEPQLARLVRALSSC